MYMRLEHKDYIYGNPICCIGIIIFLGSYIYALYGANYIMSAVISALFFIALIKWVDRKFVMILIVFFIFSFINTYFYFNTNLPCEYSEKVRVVKKNNRSYTVSSKGKEFYLVTDRNIQEGMLITVRGGFKKNCELSQGIVGTYYCDYLKIEKKDFISKIYDYKRNIYNDYSAIMGKKRAGIVMSVSLGESCYMECDMKNDFNRLGVIHASAVSGFHMAIIYKIFEKLIGYRASLVTCLLYMLFTGAKPSALRAFIMIAVFKLSGSFFKKNNSLSALGFSAVIILIVKPQYAYSLGFHLSYLSVVGIILFYKKLLRIMYKLPNKINEAWSVSLSAQVFTMPYIMMAFSNISIGFMVGSILLMPILSLLIIVGNLGVIFNKVNFIFYYISQCLKVVLFALEGGIFILKHVTPPILKSGFYEGVCYIFFLFLFFFLNKKYKEENSNL